MKLLFILLPIIFGCQVLKKSSSKNESLSNVSKENSIDKKDSSGFNVSSNKVSAKETADWWRTTVQFPRDTTVNNFYSYPSTVVYEGGKTNKESDVSSFDSSGYKNEMIGLKNIIDSLSSMKIEEAKEKKTDVSNKTMLIIIGIIYLLVEAIKLLSNKVKISLK